MAVGAGLLGGGTYWYTRDSDKALFAANMGAMLGGIAHGGYAMYRSWTAPGASANYANLLDDAAIEHVFTGDKWDSGGHVWNGSLRSFLHGITGKNSMFPRSWSREQILHAISDVATDSSAMRLMNPKAILKGKVANYKGSKIIDGVEVEAFVRGGRIVTGYPVGGSYYAMMKPIYALPTWAKWSAGTAIVGGSAAGAYWLLSK